MLEWKKNLKNKDTIKNFVEFLPDTTSGSFFYGTKYIFLVAATDGRLLHVEYPLLCEQITNTSKWNSDGKVIKYSPADCLKVWNGICGFWASTANVTNNGLMDTDRTLPTWNSYIFLFISIHIKKKINKNPLLPLLFFIQVIELYTSNISHRKCFRCLGVVFNNGWFSFFCLLVGKWVFFNGKGPLR